MINSNPPFCLVLEDIVFILENRLNVWDEMRKAPDNLKEYLLLEFRALYKNEYVEELIDGHAGLRSPSSAYYIMEDMKDFIS